MFLKKYLLCCQSICLSLDPKDHLAQCSDCNRKQQRLRERQCKYTVILLPLYSPSSQLSTEIFSERFPEQRSHLRQCLIDLNVLFFPHKCVKNLLELFIILPYTPSCEFYGLRMHHMKKKKKMFLYLVLSDYFTKHPIFHIKTVISYLPL